MAMIVIWLHFMFSNRYYCSPKCITHSVDRIHFNTFLYMWSILFPLIQPNHTQNTQQVVVAFCAAMSIMITRANQLKIQKIGEAGKGAICMVSRDSRDGATPNWMAVPSTDLVVGDLVKLDASSTASKNNANAGDGADTSGGGGSGGGWVLPCDLVIVQGTCITDESGLTGESMPVRKSEVPSTPGSYDVHRDEKNTLFAGTTLLQAGDSIAVVSNTGIRTAKGDLISAILYPAQMVFEYDEELKVVFGILSVYATVLFVISVYLQLKISPLTWISVFAFACFTISQILPPLLPVSLVIGHTKSAARLKAKKVLCVQPKRIAISGKIHAFMFDKTGTLTKQGLDFIGVHAIGGGSSGVGDDGGGDAPAAFAGASGEAAEHFSYDAKASRAGDLLSWSLATCHAVTTLRTSDGGGGGGGGRGGAATGATGGGAAAGGGGGNLVGNQVEVKMFTASNWLLDDSTATVSVQSAVTGEKLAIEKRYEFDHHTMTMSVLVRDESGNITVFCKGAPEKIAAVCKERRLPPNYSNVSAAHALQGCYVIGMATRSLGKLSPLQVSKLLRKDVEVAGEFDPLGLLLFRNELKEDTAAAIQEIKNGDVRPVMVTGDNAHCGYYIAKASSIVDAGTKVYISKLNGETVTWASMDAGRAGGGGEDDETLSTAEVLRACTDTSSASELAITGKAMAALTRQGTIDALLLHTRIFARVSPDQKVQVIQMYIDGGFITGMCGDGGNDCGALRTAHAGIALSDAEASVVSPFTSSSKSVQSVVDVLCEGRCALVTSFAAYRFYITYGLNWSIVKTVNFVYGTVQHYPAGVCLS